MKKPFLSFVLLSFILSMSISSAQEVIPASGGNAEGSGGSVSYSVGQMFYMTHEGSTGSVNEGAQQPYEISAITGIIETAGIDLVLSAFPNPVTDFLILRVDQYNPENLSYQLFDINGRLIQIGHVIGNETIIDMTGSIPAVYLLKVLDKEKEIKTFRILKQ